MQEFHDYIENKDTRLRTDLGRIQLLLTELSTKKASLATQQTLAPTPQTTSTSTTARPQTISTPTATPQNTAQDIEADLNEIATLLSDLRIRKQVELAYFNEQTRKNLFRFNADQEKKRIASDLETANKINDLLNKHSIVLAEWNNFHDEIIKRANIKKSDIEEHFNTAKKASGLASEVWENTRGFITETVVTGVIGTGIAGILDVATYISEAITNFFSARKANKKIELVDVLQKTENDAAARTRFLTDYQNEHGEALSQAKQEKYLSDDYNNKSKLQRNRRGLGIVNTALGIIGTAFAIATAGIAIATFVGAASTLLVVTSVPLGILGPGFLAMIYGFSWWRDSETQELAEENRYRANLAFQKAISPEYLPASSEYQAALQIYNKKKIAYQNDPLGKGKNHASDPLFLKQYAKEKALIKYQQKVNATQTKKWYAAIEFGSATLLTAGVTLLTLTLLGVATFGVAPTVLLGIGACVGILTTAFEFIDARNNLKYSNKIRSTLNKWFYNETPPPKPTPHLEKIRRLLPEISKVTKSNGEIDDNSLGKKNLDSLDRLYSQLHGKEKKRFRQAAWDKIKRSINTDNKISTLPEKIKYLNEAKTHAIFSKHRHTLGFFTRKPTTTVEEMNEKINNLTEELNYHALKIKDSKKIR